MCRLRDEEDDVPDGITQVGIRVVGYHIYFYSDVSLKSCLELNTTIQELTREIMANSVLEKDLQ